MLRFQQGTARWRQILCLAAAHRHLAVNSISDGCKHVTKSTSMPFQLVVITPDTLLSSPAAAELRVAQSLFDRGLQVLHVRKPGSSAEQVQQYLAALPPAARRRCQLHQHHLLAKQTAIHGIHYREADRPPGIIKAPPGLAGDLGQALACRCLTLLPTLRPRCPNHHLPPLKSPPHNSAHSVALPCLAPQCPPPSTP